MIKYQINLKLFFPKNNRLGEGETEPSSEKIPQSSDVAKNYGNNLTVP